jgi:hypothetical protein
VAPDLVPYLLSLPLTDDSWTPADEAANEAALADLRVFNAKLSRVRELLRRDPAAWADLDAIITTRLGAPSGV